MNYGDTGARPHSTAITMKRHFSERSGLPSPVENHDFAITVQADMPLASGGSRSYAWSVSPARLAAADVVTDPAILAPVQAYRDAAAPVGGAPKRAIDVAIALSALILLAPVMLTIMGVIKMTMGGSIFFAHSRIGYRGRRFRCYKFRTMVDNAEEMLARHLAEDPRAAQEWRETRKLRNDPRVTMLGHVLRKSSLDELPQLINVLRGEMSCVGPRPIVADELQRYGSHASEYLQARPGVTGMWQVSGRNTVDYAQRVAIDSHYVRHWSLWTDAVILAKTAFVVVKFNEAA